MSAQSNDTRRLTTRDLRDMAAAREPIVCLTCYDASFAALLDRAEVDVVLVGDSLGMVIQGHESTVPVSVDDMVYHSRCVAGSLKRALLMVDLPFMSYVTPNDAAQAARRLMQEGGAQMVKLEAGAMQVAAVKYLSERGVPVCAHLGLTPQWIHKLGGYRVQGRDADHARQMIEDANALVEAGADMLVLECVPTVLAEEITRAVDVPVIGIGAGAYPDGQVLVLQDMLGITEAAGKRCPKFAENFMLRADDIGAAVRLYVDEVRERSFPAEQHCFH